MSLVPSTACMLNTPELHRSRGYRGMEEGRDCATGGNARGWVSQEEYSEKILSEVEYLGKGKRSAWKRAMVVCS